MATASIKKIISAIDRLDNAGKDAVRKHLTANGRQGKSLTQSKANGYNPRMPIKTLASRPGPGIGRNIAEAREAAGMTQQQLAEAIDMTHVAVSRYETGKRRPNTPILRCIAEALGKSIDQLLAGV